LLAVEVLVIVVVLTFDFDAVDTETIWDCFGGAVTVAVVTVTVEQAKLLVAVVGTILMYWT